MAKTLDHYAYNIRNIARAGQGNSDDDRLNIRQIRFWINGYRAQGMFQATDFGKDIDPQFVQDLGVVPLEEVDKADSSCPKVEWGCKIKKVVLPQLIDFPELRALDFVGKIDKVSEIIVNHPNVAKYKAATKFGALSNRCYLIGNTLYFMLVGDDIMMEYVNIRAVFENPEDVVGYSTEGCEAKCYDPAKDAYPMPARLYEFVLRKILLNELQWTEDAVNDEMNNARKDNEKLR
jgi:hypothetical protein